MSHNQIRTLLATYRSLDAVDRAVVDRHIQGCVSCATRFSAYQRMDRDLAALEDVGPARTPRQMRAAALAGARERSSASARPLLAALVPVGLLLALVIGVLWMLETVHTPGGQVAETPSTTPTPTTLAVLGTPAGPELLATAASAQPVTTRWSPTTEWSPTTAWPSAAAAPMAAAPAAVASALITPPAAHHAGP